MVPLQYIIAPADIDAALAAGCHWLQLHTHVAADQLTKLITTCHEAGSYLLVTDDAEVCRDATADGVLLTPSGIKVLADAEPVPSGIVLQRPLPITQAIASARRTLGEDSSQFIGVLVETAQDAVAAAKAGADFIQVPAEQAKECLQAVNERSFTTPVVALGVTDAEDITTLLDQGISGIACHMKEVPPIMIPLFLNADEQ